SRHGRCSHVEGFEELSVGDTAVLPTLRIFPDLRSHINPLWQPRVNGESAQRLSYIHRGSRWDSQTWSLCTHFVRNRMHEPTDQFATATAGPIRLVASSSCSRHITGLLLK